jgi:DNA-binding transcriptional LysR family regulator
VVRPDGREHLLDRFLEDKGWQRHVTLELSHFMSLLALLPGSDLIATVPEDIATVVGRHVPLKRMELPFKPPQIHVQQFWHRRMQKCGEPAGAGRRVVGPRLGSCSLSPWERVGVRARGADLAPHPATGCPHPALSQGEREKAGS